LEEVIRSHAQFRQTVCEELLDEVFAWTATNNKHLQSDDIRFWSFMWRVSSNPLLYPSDHDKTRYQSDHDDNMKRDIRDRARADANRDRIHSNAGPQQRKGLNGYADAAGPSRQYPGQYITDQKGDANYALGSASPEVLVSMHQHTEVNQARDNKRNAFKENEKSSWFAHGAVTHPSRGATPAARALVLGKANAAGRSAKTLPPAVGGAPAGFEPFAASATQQDSSAEQREDGRRNYVHYGQHTVQRKVASSDAICGGLPCEDRSTRQFGGERR